MNEFAECLEKAKNGDSNSQFLIAEKYFLGIGIEINKKEALYWYFEASENGDKRASKKLGDLMYYGEIFNKDIEEAKNFYNESDIESEEISKLYDDFYIEYNENKEKIKDEKEAVLSHYFSEFPKHQILSKEEETELFLKYHSGSEYAYEKLVICNLRLVYKNVLNFVSYNDSYFWDYFQEGVIGLLKAIEKFDLSKGFKFSTYSFSWINQKIRRAMQDYPFIVKIPNYCFEEWSNIRNCIKENGFNEDNIPNSNLDEIITRTNLNTYRYLLLKNTFSQMQEISINDESGEFSNNIFKENNTPETIFTEKDKKEELLYIINNLEVNLRKKEIIKLYYGFMPYDKQHTLEEIGKIYGVTRERIRQEKNKVEDKLRIKLINIEKGIDKSSSIKKRRRNLMEKELEKYIEQYRIATKNIELNKINEAKSILIGIIKNFSKTGNIEFWKNVYKDIILVEIELENYNNAIFYCNKSIENFKDNSEFIEEAEQIKEMQIKNIKKLIENAEQLYDNEKIEKSLELYLSIIKDIETHNIKMSEEILENVYIIIGDIYSEMENEKAEEYYLKAFSINPENSYLKSKLSNTEITKEKSIGLNILSQEETMTKNIVLEVLEQIRKDDIDIFNKLKNENTDKKEIKGLISGIEGMLEIKFGISSLDLVDKIKSINNLDKIYLIKEKILVNRDINEVRTYIENL